MGKCTEEEKKVYNAVCTILEEIDIDGVNPTDPLASGVLDLTKLGDTYMNLLPADVVELLTVSNFLKEVDLPPAAQKMLDEFEETYKHLGTDFSLSDMDGIGYPAGIKDRQLKRNMGMMWSVLEGFRNIWTCTPRLDETNYSENALVVEAVSRILKPIFGYCSMPLEQVWGEHISESSKHRTGAAASPNKPDLCIRVDFQGADVELAFCEFASLGMGHPKHRDDWRKSVRACKDGSDMLRDICFEGKKTDCNEAIILIRSLNNIPSIAILNKKTNLTFSVIDTFNGKFFKAYKILDIDIPLRPVDRQVVEDFLKKALQVKTFVEEVACEVIKVLEKSISLPVDDNEDIATRLENLTIASTTFSS
ncbi:2301_t:CDS:2 [Paraglomus brasilianum]|uniref:2301_t:CDS:1 n=1 Tax=Paraglomus brasilianum TaxID=144538 RepID=A0A9N9DQE3_9GLOM|nr:2301_t:CDS:2 [Paraglomus brasilianum]